MKRSFYLSRCLLSAVCCLLPLAGCGKKEAPAPVERVVNVRVQPAEKRYLRPFIQSVGTLNAYEEVVVSAELDGILRELYVREGSAVSKGQTVALIDDTDYRLEVRRAEAALRQAEAALANTKTEFQRKESLHKEQLVTQQQFDDVATRVTLADAEVERAKASLSLARQKLSKTKILSPISGAVKERKAERGNFVKNGAHLLTVINANPVKLSFSVTDRDISRMKKDQEVIFTVDAYPGREFKGKLTSIYPSLAENTRSLRVEALAQNPDGALKPGLFAEIFVFTGAERETILVPATSLLYEGNKVAVFVAEGDRAHERAVRIGQKFRLREHEVNRESADASPRAAGAARRVDGAEPRMQEFSEITEGLKAGDLVITVGQQNLFEGAKIAVLNGVETKN